jgi:signal transduction histidine kinase
VNRTWQRSQQTETPHELEYRIVRPSGEVRYIHSKVRFFSDQMLGTKHWAGAALDTTDRVKAEQDLLEAKERAEFADRQKSEFLTSMSHELRTPLNAIIGFSQIMEGELYGPVGDDRYAEYIRDILTSGEHLLSLINDVLDLSRIEAGRKVLREVEIDVGLLVQNNVRMLQATIDKAGLDCRTEFSDALPLLWADERAISQIILNLLSNAIKFTEPGGRISASAYLQDDGGLALSISDTGIGIKAEDIPQVLSRFGQVDSACNRKIEGTGLGLQLVDSLAKLHGGEIDLSSEFGMGTTATVRFPKARTRKREPL